MNEGNMKRVLCLLAEGFEEIEALAPVDLLRRAGVEVVMAAAGGTLEVRGRSGITVHADCLLDGVDPGGFDLLLLPGGPAVAGLRQGGVAAGLARDFAGRGKVVAAICAAPLLLKDAGLLEGTRFTAHFSAAAELPDALGSERVVEDGPLITSRGAGASIDFGLALVRRVCGAEAAVEVARAIMD